MQRLPAASRLGGQPCFAMPDRTTGARSGSSDVAAVSAMLDRFLHHGHFLKCGPRSRRTKAVHES